MKRTIYVASPGTGKTTALIKHVGELISKGTSSRNICFTTFTKHAAEDAVRKACYEFNLKPKDFPYFRTLHSLAFQALRCPTLVDNIKDFYSELFSLTGVPISFNQSMYSQADSTNGMLGDECLNIHNKSRNLLTDPRQVMLQDSRFRNIDYTVYKQQIAKYEWLKQKHEAMDYTDLLISFLNNDHINIPVEHIFVDEYQDCTPLQCQMCRKIEANGAHMTVAGDDKQSIYEFNGGDPSKLINMEGERIILDKSYRLKTNMVAFSEKIANRIRNKTPYAINGHAEGGKVSFIQSLQGLCMDEGTWLLIGRRNDSLGIFIDHCDKIGYKYINNRQDNTKAFEAIKIWEEFRSGQWLPIDDFKSVLPYLESGTTIRRGAKKQIEMDPDTSTKVNMGMLESMYGVATRESWYQVFRMESYKKEIIRRMVCKEGCLSKPRIRIATIHGAKGLEAENVCLIPSMSQSCQETLKSNPDSEHRVFYVASTRAKENLYILKSDDMDYQF